MTKVMVVFSYMEQCSLSCLILSFSVLFCLFLSYFVLFCLILSFSVFFCLILSFSVLFCLFLSYSVLFRLFFSVFWVPLRQNSLATSCKRKKINLMTLFLHSMFLKKQKYKRITVSNTLCMYIKRVLKMFFCIRI